MREKHERKLNSKSNKCPQTKRDIYLCTETLPAVEEKNFPKGLNFAMASTKVPVLDIRSVDINGPVMGSFYANGLNTEVSAKYQPASALKKMIITIF